MSGIQDIESNNEAMICTGDNPAHNQTMYKDVYKYIFYQGCLNGLMIITGHTQHSNKLNVDFGRKLEFIFRRVTNSGSVYYDHGFYQGSFEVQTVKPSSIYRQLTLSPRPPWGRPHHPWLQMSSGPCHPDTCQVLFRSAQLSERLLVKTLPFIWSQYYLKYLNKFRKGWEKENWRFDWQLKQFLWVSHVFVENVFKKWRESRVWLTVAALKWILWASGRKRSVESLFQ